MGAFALGIGPFSGVLKALNGSSPAPAECVLDVTRFGAKGDGRTDNTHALQDAIQAAASAGGGLVCLPAGVFMTGGLALPSRVTLAGSGHAATVLKLANGKNATVVEQDSFSGLAGSNRWFVGREGVPYGFGLMGLAIDGNRSENPRGGNGVSFYGKNYVIHDVHVLDCAGVGVYSEAGDLKGQDDARDLPESQIDLLTVRGCGSHGILFRGPHDSVFGRVVSCVNGGAGFLADERAGKYGGQCFVRYLHSYANETGVDIRANVRFGYLECESNRGDGAVLSAAGTRVDTLSAYRNGGRALLIRDRENIVIGTAHVLRSGSSSGTAVEVVGAGYSGIGLAHVDGGGEGGIGMLVNSSDFRFRGTIKGFSASGGVGLDLAGSNDVTNVVIDANIHDCAIGFRYTNRGRGARNYVRITAVAGQGQTAVAGDPPSLNDRFDLSFVASGNLQGSTRSAVLSEVFAIDSIGLRTMSLPHRLPFVPSVQKVQVTVVTGSGPTDWGYDLVAVRNVDATNVTISVNVNRPSKVRGATARLAVALED